MPAQTHWSVPRKQLLIVKKLRASQLRCAPGYRHNDITVLIIGKPNMGTTSLSICAFTPNFCVINKHRNITFRTTLFFNFKYSIIIFFDWWAHFLI